MGLGIVFAFVSAFAFAINHVLVRKATHKSEESFSVVAVSILIGTPLIWIIAGISGQWRELPNFSLHSILPLVGAGILNFVITRYLLFSGIRLIGANRTVAISKTDVIFSLLFGSVMLNEHVTIYVAAGAFIIMLGTIIVSMDKSGQVVKMRVKGLVMVLGAAVGIPIAVSLVRMALAETDALYAAVSISYASALIVILIILITGKQHRKQLLNLPRKSFRIMCLVSVFVLAGQVFRFAALEYSPVSVVQPLIGVTVLFVFFLSLAMNRNIEVFNWRAITGIVLVAVGAFLVGR